MNLDISNGQGILDDTAHLTCYEIEADDDETAGEEGDDDDDPDERGRIGSVSIIWLLALGMNGVIHARNRKL